MKFKKKKKSILFALSCLKIVSFVRQCGKYCRARHGTHHNIIRQMRFLHWLDKSIGIHSICTTYCFSTSTKDTQPHHNVTVIRTVTVIFVSVFANCAVDLHNNSISTRNVKLTYLKVCIFSSKEFNAGNYLNNKNLG
jgi:hypothetical protein